jgi:hypothetical protein
MEAHMNKSLIQLFVFCVCLAQIGTAQNNRVLLTTRTVDLPSSDYAQSDNPPCYVHEMDNAAQLIGGLAATGFTSSNPTLAVLSPGVASATYAIVERAHAWINKQGGDIAKFISPNRYATCGVVAIPIDKLKGRRYQAIEYTVRIAEKGTPNVGGCHEGAGAWTKCDVGWAAYTVSNTPGFANLTVKNWCHDRDRVAVVEVYGVLKNKR